MPGGKILERIEMVLRGAASRLPVYIDVYDSSLGQKWLTALKDLLDRDYHLEKNYCFLGFVPGDRSGEFILDQINHSIDQINRANIGYRIDDWFTLANTLHTGPVAHDKPGLRLQKQRMNDLHRYFEDLQGVSGAISDFAQHASSEIKWHIRQLNLLCHEFESWALSHRKSIYAPEWQRPSQLMCWLNAPRFVLDETDYDLFGIETINRPLGGVYVGVNKAVGKHHWEVFNDEGKDSRIDELTTSTLRSQTEAAGDFDIEWANDPGQFQWQRDLLDQFRDWLVINGFDPQDKSLTIGHPQVAQVDLQQSFGTGDYRQIWQMLSQHLDVFSMRIGGSYVEYPYRWQDRDYMQQQVAVIEKGR